MLEGEEMKVTRIFQSGPPPHVGWWWSDLEGSRAWRWFDGEAWSGACYDHYDLEVVSYWSSLPLWEVELIKWSSYWPKNARVKRVAP